MILILRTVKILTVLCSLFTCNGNDITTDSTLQCHRRIYDHTVIKKDLFGKSCWDVIPILSCWGRCDSHEISDWKFPFKRSHHPVCIHNVRERITVILRNCDNKTEPGTEIFEFYQAFSCKCSVCKSSEASCESIRYKEQKFHPQLMLD